jgi:dipeptidyl aminopeptidase/acylaminoacyl peptidase
MPDLQEVFRSSTQKVRPDPGALQRQQRAQRRRAAGRKYGALAVAAAIAVVAAVVLLATQHAATSGEPLQSGNPPTGASAPSNYGVQTITTTGDLVRTFPYVPTFADRVTLSPDGSSLAYVDPYITVMNVDGGDQRRLIPAPSGSIGDAQDGVSFSPDGRRIVFAWRGGIYTMPVDAHEIPNQLVSDALTGDFDPEWSPDGSTIVYWNGSKTGVDGGPNNAEICTIAAGGGTPTRLTHDDVSDIEPTWSPDGSQIAYFHGGELWVMDADGADQHRVYRGEGGAWSPSWSPDGQRIAFLRFAGNPTGILPMMEIRILDLATGEVSVLPGIRTATDNNGPVWVSDTELLINRYR